jgi:hypothetical protein
MCNYQVQLGLSLQREEKCSITCVIFSGSGTTEYKAPCYFSPSFGFSELIFPEEKINVFLFHIEPYIFPKFLGLYWSRVLSMLHDIAT